MEDLCTVHSHQTSITTDLHSLPWKPELPAGHCLECLGPIYRCTKKSKQSLLFSVFEWAVRLGSV